LAILRLSPVTFLTIAPPWRRAQRPLVANPVIARYRRLGPARSNAITRRGARSSFPAIAGALETHMLKKLSLAAALAAIASGAWATTTVGSATLVDNAVVHAGTVAATSFLTYVSGGNGVTGTSDGSSYAYDGVPDPAAAMAAADHRWLQYDAPIFMTSGNTFLSSVLALPALDHGWTSGNTGEFWEPFEFRIFGCTAATATACTEGKITDVYTRGIDDTGAAKNADDFASVWGFDRSYNIFMITSGDRLVGGGLPGYSPGEGEIDALAVAAPVPEPSEFALMIAGLGALGFVARRKRRLAA
jgi:hypothetical protein